MKLIAAADAKWGIGLKNELLVRIPQDQQYFRQETTGRVVVMGRKTLESFPNQKPLPNRVNIVMTRQEDYAPEGVTVVHDIDELKKVLKQYDPEDLYCIGGEQIYKLLLPLCDTALITRIDHVYEADAYLPDLDHDPEWKLTMRSEEQTYFSLIYYFLTYERISGGEKL